MSTRRKIVIALVCLFAAVLFFFLKFYYSSGYSDRPLPVQTNSTGPQKNATVAERQEHFPDPAEAGQKGTGQSNLLPDSWYSSKPVVNSALTGLERGVPLNMDLAHDLKLTGEEKLQISTALQSTVQSINSKETTLVNDGGPPPKIWVGPNASVFRIDARNVNPAEIQQALKSDLVTLLGEDRGTLLFERIALAADGDPLLRGFGLLPLEITFKAVGGGDIKRAMIYWDYKVLRKDGSMVSSGSRNGAGLPPGLKDIFDLSKN